MLGYSLKDKRSEELMQTKFIMLSGLTNIVVVKLVRITVIERYNSTESRGQCEHNILSNL